MTTPTFIGMHTIAVPVTDQERTKALFERFGLQTSLDTELRPLPLDRNGARRHPDLGRSGADRTGVARRHRYRYPPPPQMPAAHARVIERLDAGELLDWETARHVLVHRLRREPLLRLTGLMPDRAALVALLARPELVSSTSGINLPRTGNVPIARKCWEHVVCERPQASLGVIHDCGSHRDARERHLGIGHKIVVPVRVSQRTAVRGRDDDAPGVMFGVVEVDECVAPNDARSSAARLEHSRREHQSGGQPAPGASQEPRVDVPIQVARDEQGGPRRRQSGVEPSEPARQPRGSTVQWMRRILQQVVSGRDIARACQSYLTVYFHRRAA